MCSRKCSEMKLWCTCQSRFGRTMSSVNPQPRTNHRLARWRRAGVRTNPTSNAATKKTTVYLAITPRPVKAAIQSHQRSSSLSSSEHPTELLEGGVLKLSSFKDRYRGERSREGRRGYRGA